MLDTVGLAEKTSGAIFNFYRNVAQLVERTLWERGVTGSNPAIPTIL